MSSRTELDLSQLVRQRSSREEARGRRSSRKWLTRYIVPGAILAGFGALMIASAGISWWPRPPVRLLPVIVKRSTVQPSGTPLFQAAGWIEPRPTATNVTALAPGVVESLLVVEGQSVTQGQPIARLIAIDAELAVKQAKANLAIATGDLERAQAEQQAAKIRLEQPVHLKVELADSRSVLARAETTLSNLPYQIESAAANLKFLQQSEARKRSAGSAVPGNVLQRTESDLAAADARLRELRQRKPGLQQELDALRQKVAALELRLQLLVEEKRQLAEANAKVQSAVARRESAQLQLEKAQLNLQRNTIRAPFDGRILKLIATPGTRVLGLDSQGDHKASLVVQMYDPNQLQIRADVRLEHVPLVQPGQEVEVETASSEKKIKGRVLQANSLANVQKNTLEVKVELIDPPANVRPEMLVTATFLAPESQIKETANQAVERILIPERLIQSPADQPAVWVIDPAQRAQLVSIQVGQPSENGLVSIESGLTVTDKLIASGFEDLKTGARVHVVGELESTER